ncbi:MAG: uracil-DNA glycosylase [Acidobacteriota bacterium]
MTPNPPLADLLDYLSDIGYGDAYLRPRAAASKVVEPATEPRSAAEAGAAPGARAAVLATIGEEASRCTACKLAAGRHSVVFGSGNPAADLIFIGEGPGAEEDRQGLPFVGRAGELLTRMIQAMEMRRDEVYIANIVKCRPPGNRDPEPDEVAACRSFLERQIQTIQPRVLCALGRVAAQTLLGVDTPIGRLRGQWHEKNGIPMMVTYHPAALLRNPAFKRPTWDDLQQVRDRLRTRAE